MQQMADIMQKSGGDQGAAGAGLLRAPSRLQGMLGLADRFAKVGSIAPFLEQSEDSVDWIFVSHLSLRGLLMISVEENATGGQNDDGLEQAPSSIIEEGRSNPPSRRSRVLTHGSTLSRNAGLAPAASFGDKSLTPSLVHRSGSDCVAAWVSDGRARPQCRRQSLPTRLPA